MTAVLPLTTTQSIAVVGDLADVANLGDRGSSMVTSSEVTTPLAGLRVFGNEVDLHYYASDADISNIGEFDVAVVVAGLTYKEEGEFIPTQQQESDGSVLARGGDRADLRLPESQERLIREVALTAKKTIVLLEGGSAIEVSSWVNEVDALMMVWYPGPGRRTCHCPCAFWSSQSIRKATGKFPSIHSAINGLGR